MLFNSYTFLVFFLLMLVVSRWPLGWSARKALLLAGSYIFYAAWNPPFVLLLWLSTLVDWKIASVMHSAHTEARRKLCLLGSLAVNLGLLAYFKYGDFLLDNFVGAASVLGWEILLARPNIILPVGISFYTFQTLSYTLDVYRRRMAPWHSFLDFALYVSFFPQLVAGPIVRATDFLPQCQSSCKANQRQFIWGIYLFVMGLFGKVVVADGIMAGVVECIFDQTPHPGIWDAWTGALAFSMQIFFDFSGYSACAIGVALCLGFVLPDNFRFPYAALGFSEFWQRWHISLSSWLRDYLYIPMGGNRKGQWRTHVNLMATMLLGGLWHGASWLFVWWGGLHGLYLITERVCVASPLGRWRCWQSVSGKVFLILMTYLLVCVAWVFFRAGSLDQAIAMLGGMAGLTGAFSALVLEPIEYCLVGLSALAMLLYQGLMRQSSTETVWGRWPGWVRAVAVAMMAFGVLLAFHGEDRAFIYFQF